MSNGEHVTIIDIVTPPQDLKITSPIGTVIPLLAGAVGKVLLAGLEEHKASEIIRLEVLKKYTRFTTTNRKAYLQELKQVRSEGYATDDEGYILGVRAVAAPLDDVAHLMAAIWVVGFKASLDDNKMKVLAAETKLAADAISRRIREKSFH